ncbi:hypothetical protein SRHO_G00333420 [Serrasalmus rhombeus]
MCVWHILHHQAQCEAATFTKHQRTSAHRCTSSLLLRTSGPPRCESPHCIALDFSRGRRAGGGNAVGADRCALLVPRINYSQPALWRRSSAERSPQLSAHISAPALVLARAEPDSADRPLHPFTPLARKARAEPDSADAPTSLLITVIKSQLARCVSPRRTVSDLEV